MSIEIHVKKYRLFSILRLILNVQLVLALYLSSLTLFISSGYASTESRAVSIRTSILALDSARTTAINELASMSLSTQETADYRNFVIFLNTRIMNYCQELTQRTSRKELADLPCPTTAGRAAVDSAVAEQENMNKTAIPYPPVVTGSTKTRGEKTAELDDQFLDTLGDFDDMLLKEDEKVASRIPRQRETGATGTVGGGIGSGAAGGEGNTGSGDYSATGEQGMGTDAGSAAAGASGTQTGRPSGDGAPGAGSSDNRNQQARTGAPGGQLPPPEDDDIVARQLREAAEKETDPELKKKLWEEYYKYKGLTPKGG